MAQAAVITTNDPAEAGTAKTIYILYLVGLLVGVTTIIGVIMAYVNRSDAPAWVQSHYQVQIRTFWIGMLYGVASFLDIHRHRLLARLVHAGVVDRTLRQGAEGGFCRRAIRERDDMAVVAQPGAPAR